MRKQYILSVLLLLLFEFAASAASEYTGQMHVTPLTLEQKGDSLYVRIRFDITGVNVDTEKSISLIPTLSASEKQLRLPEVMVKGRINYNVYQREVSLMSRRQRAEYAQRAPYAVMPGFKTKGSQTVDYTQVLKFEPWMAAAKLDMFEDLCGCGNPPRRMGVTMLVNEVVLEKVIIIEPYTLVPYLAYVQPEVETIKRREITGEAFLDFVVNKIDIRPDYMNNPRELKKITDLIKEVRSDSNILVKSLNVIGFASPEGRLESNRRLSEGRANALVDYLVPGFDYPRSMYNVKFGGENWAGLKHCVDTSNTAFRQQVLQILENTSAEMNAKANADCKRALMSLSGGIPYRQMLRDYYPSLRKAVCTIDFEVKQFSVEQAREIVKTHPQNLSLNEMFRVANTYEKGSQDFVDLFETAVRLFSSDVTANLNAASAALLRNDLVYAERYLNKIDGKTTAPEYYNARGVLLMLKGEYDRAEEFLRQAQNAGLDEAKQNLAEIAKKRKNIILLEEHRAQEKR